MSFVGFSAANEKIKKVFGEKSGAAISTDGGTCFVKHYGSGWEVAGRTFDAALRQAKKLHADAIVKEKYEQRT